MAEIHEVKLEPEGSGRDAVNEGLISSSNVSENYLSGGYESVSMIKSETISLSPDAESGSSTFPVKYSCSDVEDLTDLQTVQSGKHAKPNECAPCNDLFSDTSDLSQHSQHVHPTTNHLRCTQCEKSFSIEADLSQHITSVHSEEEGLNTDKYDFQSTDDNVLRLQISAVQPQNERLQCSQCDALFSFTASLNIHMRVVHNVFDSPSVPKSYLCSDCGMSFAATSRLKLHRWIAHLKLKPYSCIVGSQSFTEMDSLGRHVPDIHSRKTMHQRDQVSGVIVMNSSPDEHMKKKHERSAQSNGLKEEVKSDRDTLSFADELSDIKRETLQERSAESNCLVVDVKEEYISANEILTATSSTEGLTDEETTTLQERSAESNCLVVDVKEEYISDNEELTATSSTEGLTDEEIKTLQERSRESNGLKEEVKSDSETLSSADELTDIKREALEERSAESICLVLDVKKEYISANEILTATSSTEGLTDEEKETLQERSADSNGVKEEVKSDSEVLSFADELTDIKRETLQERSAETNCLVVNVKKEYTSDNEILTATSYTEGLTDEETKTLQERSAETNCLVVDVKEECTSDCVTLSVTSSTEGLTDEKTETIKDLTDLQTVQSGKHAKPNECAPCIVMFIDLSQHSQHVHQTTNHLRCAQCEKSFGIEADLSQHIKSVHSKEEGLNTEKYDFPSTYDNVLILQMSAVQPQNESHMCSECGVLLSCTASLSLHMRVVHSELDNPPVLKSYSCSDCGRSYLTIGGLKTHRRMAHINKRLYSCTVCIQNFTEVESLVRHVREIHRPTRKNLFQRDKVSGAFVMNSRLDEYLRTMEVESNEDHTYSMSEEKIQRYRCPVCKKNFRDTCRVRQHMLSRHKDDTQQRGTHDKKSLDDKSDLMEHINGEHGDTTHKYNLLVEKANEEDESDFDTLIARRSVEGLTDEERETLQERSRESNGLKEEVKSDSDTLSFADELTDIKRETLEGSLSTDTRNQSSKLTDHRPTCVTEIKPETLRDEEWMDEISESGTFLTGDGECKSEVECYVEDYAADIEYNSYGEESSDPFVEISSSHGSTEDYFDIPNIKRENLSVQGDASVNKSSSESSDDKELATLLQRYYSKFISDAEKSLSVDTKDMKGVMSTSQASESTIKYRKCPQCGRIFSSFEYLKRHIQREHLAGKLHCYSACVKLLSEHTTDLISNVSGSNVWQKYCNVTPSSQQQDARTKSTKCPICEKSFDDFDCLKLHIRYIHLGESEHRCLHWRCGKSFISESDLALHVKHIHVGKKYSCTECAYSSKSGQNFKAHFYTVHLKKKPYKCPQCESGFTQKDYLIKHIRNVHRLQKPYSCDDCHKAFSQRQSLRLHINAVHKRIKPHSCSQCERTFSTKQNLEKHVKCIHLKLKPYTCFLCSKQFASKAEIKIHIDAFHNDNRPYKCKQCHESFSLKNSLSKHTKKQHKQ